MAADRVDINQIFDIQSFKELAAIQDILKTASKELNQQINKQTKSLNALAASINENEDALKKYADLIKKATGSQIAKLSSETDKLVEENKKLNKSYEQQAKTIQKLQDELAKVNKTKKQATDFDKQRAQLQKKIAQSTKEEAKELADLREQLRRNNKELRDNAKAAQSTTREYNKLVRETRKAKNEAKELGAQYGRSSREFRQAAKRARELDKQLKELDSSVGDNFRNVGNYQSALKGLNTVLGVAGIAGGLELVRQGFSKFIDVTQEFEQQLARVQAISGASSQEFQKLRNDALRLGASTSKTGAEVGQLQEEFAKLGFTTDEIINATEATLQLSIATQSDLATAAEVAGSTLRGFGLDASETARVTDVMAKSFTTSALDLSNFRESMKFVAPVAKAAGVSIEETAALLGTLADAGIKGSNAGTALRRILGDMSKEGKTAAESIKELSQQGLTLEDAFDEVGRTAQTALLVLADNTDKTDELTKSYNMAAGAASNMANIVEDTLSGDIAKLNSAFEGLLLTMGDSGLLSAVRSSVQALTSLISVTNKESDALEAQRQQLNFLVDAIVDTNTPTETRTRLIERLNEQYPELLENLDKETVTNEQLKERLALVNAELIKNIRIKINQEKIAEAQAKLQETIIKLDEEAINLQKLEDAGNRRNILNSRQRLKNLESTRNELLKLINELTKNNIANDDLAKSNDNLAKTTQNTSNANTNQTKTTTQLTGAIEKQQKVVADLQAEKKKANEADISAINQRLELEEKELKRLIDLGKTQAPVVDDSIEREKAASAELADFRKQQEIDVAEEAKERLKLQEELITQQRDRLLANTDLTNSERLLIQEEYNQKLIDANKEYLDTIEKQEEESLKKQKELRQEIFGSVLADAAFQALEQEIQNKVLLAGLEAYLNALQRGETADVAISEGTQAIAGAQIIKSLSQGFHDGGYTGDGHEYEVAGVAHKGEFVNTAKQTTEYGMKGWTASDFDHAIDTGYFNQFANTNKAISDTIPLSNITLNNNIDYDKMGKSVAENIDIPVQDVSWFGDHLQSKEKSKKYNKTTTYKSKGSYYVTPKAF